MYCFYFFYALNTKPPLDSFSKIIVLKVKNLYSSGNSYINFFQIPMSLLLLILLVISIKKYKYYESSLLIIFHLLYLTLMLFLGLIFSDFSLG